MPSVDICYLRYLVGHLWWDVVLEMSGLFPKMRRNQHSPFLNVEYLLLDRSMDKHIR